MADYKDIKGGTVQNFAGDPPAPITGQVWYDSTNVTFQYQFSAPEAWVTGGNLNTARYSVTGAGSQTAGLAAAGYSTTNTVVTETYDGSSWTEVGDQNTAAEGRGGAGSNTSAVIVGGRLGPPGSTANSEEWNGSSWTEGSNINGPRYNMRGTGVNNTAVLVAGGQNPGAYPPSGQTGATETYDGSSWTEVSDLNTIRNTGSMSGTNTAALFTGGFNPAISPITRAETESWNGSAWTEVGDLNRVAYGGAMFGTSTATIYGGGSPPDTTALTEKWNGSSWTEVSDLNTGRYRLGYGPTGTTTAGIAIAGRTDTHVANVEEWHAPAAVTYTITTS